MFSLRCTDPDLRLTHQLFAICVTEHHYFILFIWWNASVQILQTQFFYGNICLDTSSLYRYNILFSLEAHEFVCSCLNEFST